MDRRLLGRVDAVDILQEAYLDAAQRMRHVAKGLPPSAFRWLRSITLQTLINVQRRHLATKIRDAGREVSLQASWARPTSVALAGKLLDNIMSQLGGDSERGLLEEALDSLTSIAREVLSLRHFEELTNQEVAEVLERKEKSASIRP